jgi:hypothetical protein
LCRANFCAGCAHHDEHNQFLWPADRAGADELDDAVAPVATEAVYLVLAHAFETLGYRRFEWKCDSLNAPSRAAVWLHLRGHFPPGDTL